MFISADTLLHEPHTCLRLLLPLPSALHCWWSSATSGRLARAFAAGYYCSDEQELMRECGVYLPR